MSSPDGLSRRAFSRLFIVAAAAPLAGCIEPLYGPGGVGGLDMAAELRAIAVDPIPDRFGHYLGAELIFALNGSGSKPPPKYRLLVAYKNRVQTPIIDSVTGRADSATVWADVTYQLLPAAGGLPVVSGSVASLADYDRSSQRYANIRAARDAEIRAAKSVADQIRLHLSAGLAPKG
jgi:LPS-assembly lipoprotein